MPRGVGNPLDGTTLKYILVLRIAHNLWDRVLISRVECVSAVKMLVLCLQGMGPKRPSTGSMSARATANHMLEVKNARKRAEADVHLLANRLAHLQAEEEKARRKTEETRLVSEREALGFPTPALKI